MTDRLITPPAALPVTVREAATAARINGTDLDSELLIQIAAITEETEHLLGRALITQTWEVTLDAFPDAVRLPMAPVQEVVSVKYLDVDGGEKTLAPADYYSDLVTEPSYIVPGAGLSWPETYDRINAVTVRVKCGYGDSGSAVPLAIRQYILARVAEEQAPAGTPKSPHLCRLLDRYTVY